MLLALTIVATLCCCFTALATFALVLGHRGRLDKALVSVFLYAVPVIVTLWILYASIP